MCLERGAGEGRLEKAQRPRPGGRGGGRLSAVVVGKELVEEVFRRGIGGGRSGLEGLVGQRFGAAHVVHADDDGLRGLDGGEADDDHEEEDHERPERPRGDAEMAVGDHGVSPDVGELLAGIRLGPPARACCGAFRPFRTPLPPDHATPPAAALASLALPAVMAIAAAPAMPRPPELPTRAPASSGTFMAAMKAAARSGMMAAR